MGYSEIIKVVLLSDIHGNLSALNAVAKALAKLDFDLLLVAGDSVGYYPNSLEVIRVLSELDARVIAGNHERMLLRAIDDKSYLDWIKSKYGSSIQIALDEMTSTDFQWVASLPSEISICCEPGLISCFHGSPRNCDEYIYPDSSLQNLNDHLPNGTKWVVLGHTHYPMDRMSENVRYINPGSVGQPRNSEKNAHWALLDTERNEVDFFTEKYERESLLDWARSTHPGIPALAYVLQDTREI